MGKRKKKEPEPTLPEPSFDKVLCWFGELKNGGHKKGVAYLYDSDDDTLCCLGVAMLSMGDSKSNIDKKQLLSKENAALLGLDSNTHEKVTLLNDITHRHDTDFSNVLRDLLLEPNKYFCKDVSIKISQAHERGDI